MNELKGSDFFMDASLHDSYDRLKKAGLAKGSK